MTEEQMRLNELSERVIGCAYKVGSALGRGFLESVYQNALAHEFGKQSLQCRQQDRVVVRYDGIIVGDFQLDMIVENALVVEVKAVADITANHEAQLLNYLKAAKLTLGLVLNFGGASVQVRRKVNGF